MATKKRTPWDYIVPITMPADLRGVTPGKLDNSLLRSIPGGGKLHWLAAAAWMSMVEAARADGVELKPTSAGDTYRDYETQKRGFLTRYQLAPIKGTSTKEFEGKTWYLKKGMAMLATPGKSNHNLGLAVDVHSAAEPRRIKWLIDNVAKFGWSWEVVPSEPWHIRYVAGDKVPAAVAEWMERNGVEKPEATARPSEPRTSKAGDDIKSDMKDLQKALKARGFYNGEITGVKDAATNEAIKAFKLANGLPGDFIAGPRVLVLLDLD